MGTDFECREGVSLWGRDFQNEVGSCATVR